MFYSSRGKFLVALLLVSSFVSTPDIQATWKTWFKRSLIGRVLRGASKPLDRSNIVKRARSRFTKKTVKRCAIYAAALVIGGFVLRGLRNFLNYDLGNDIVVAGVPCKGVVLRAQDFLPDHHAGGVVQVKQVEVCIQPWGSASCGYHGLKNTFFIMCHLEGHAPNDLVAPNGNQLRPLRTDLCDPEAVRARFGEFGLFSGDDAGPWRETIIDARDVDDYGEWLHDDEIIRLRDERLPNEYQNQITIIGGANDLDLMNEHHDFFEDDLHQRLVGARNGLQGAGDYSHGFVLACMRREACEGPSCKGGKKAGGSREHWISLVVNKYHGDREYIIADSNGYRIGGAEREAVRSLIGFLEGN